MFHDSEAWGYYNYCVTLKIDLPEFAARSNDSKFNYREHKLFTFLSSKLLKVV